MACALLEDSFSSKSSSKNEWTLLEEFTAFEDIDKFLKVMEFRSATYQTNHRLDCIFCPVNHRMKIRSSLYLQDISQIA